MESIAGRSLGVVDVLLGQLGSIKPVTPAQVLANQRDGHGCLVGVQLGHVQVIHKIDELLGAWRPIVDASLYTMTRMQCTSMTMDKTCQISIMTGLMGTFRCNILRLSVLKVGVGNAKCLQLRFLNVRCISCSMCSCDN